MIVTIYLKDGMRREVDKAYDVEYVDWYDEREVWIHYGQDSILKYKETEIEQIKIRME